MYITSKRFTDLKAKLQKRMIESVKADSPLAAKYVSRLNRVLTIQRARNLANGMPGKPWVAYTIDQVKAEIQKRGL